VATIKPPIIAVAIGPQKVLAVSGIIASTAVMVVSMIGLKRDTTALMMASRRAAPAATSCS